MPYIDKDETVRLFAQDYAYAAADIAKEIPYVDVKPVVHAKWIEYKTPNIICCSACDFGTGKDEKTNYCPNCGAKMDV